MNIESVMVWINCSVCCWFCYFKYLPHLFFMLYHQNLYTAFCLKYISLIFSSGILQIRCNLESLMLQIEDLLIINKTHFFLTSWKSNYQSIFWNSLSFQNSWFYLHLQKCHRLPAKWSLGNATLTIITLFKILASNYLYIYQVHQSIHVHGIYLKAAMS